MNPHYTYLLVDVSCFIFPFLFSFHPAFMFYTSWRAFIPANLLTALFFIVWDMAFTHLGVWSFNPSYTLGLNLVNLPLEELLFFFCVPYACVFTYHCLKLYISRPLATRIPKMISLLLVLGLPVIATLFFNKLYTSVTFILLAGVLAFTLLKKPGILPRFFLGFVLILPFFFLSNGILTGSFIEEPVVNYNSLHNLGIRLFTIPMEDVFYGMLLLLLNIGLFEFFLEKNKTAPAH